MQLFDMHDWRLVDLILQKTVKNFADMWGHIMQRKRFCWKVKWKSNEETWNTLPFHVSESFASVKEINGKLRIIVY